MFIIFKNDFYLYLLYLNNLKKLIECQNISKRIIKRKRFVKYIKSREFNEWFYAPNGIGKSEYLIV